MHSTRFLPSLLILLTLLSGCITIKVEYPATPTGEVENPITPTSKVEALLPTPNLSATASADPHCVSSLDRHMVRDPHTNTPRYTFSTEEFERSLADMQITSMCLPARLGAPYLAYDYNAQTLPTTQGRMVVIYFEGPADDGPFARGQLVYATYDFRAPTEYNTFATAQDYLDVQQGKMDRVFQVNDGNAFVRIQPSIPMGKTTLFLTYVIPFSDHYAAVVYDLGAYDQDLEAMQMKFNAADYPPEYQPAISVYSAMFASIRFNKH